MANSVCTADFNEKVINAEGLILVDFSADWCGPCKMVAPILEEIATQHKGEVTIYSLDVDENREVAVRYGIMSIPCLILFENGAALKQTIGAQPKEAILEFIGLQ